MNKRFHIVAKAKLNKKRQAEREAKDGKRPKLPWKKAKDSAGTSLGAITEMSFKDYLKEAKRGVDAGQELKQLRTMPRLQKQGDFVWYLYKFFDQQKTKNPTRQNPAYKKAFVSMAKEAIKQTKQKFANPRSRAKSAHAWANVDTAMMNKYARDAWRYKNSVINNDIDYGYNPGYRSLVPAVMTAEERNHVETHTFDKVWSGNRERPAARRKYDQSRAIMNRADKHAEKMAQQVLATFQQLYNQNKHTLPVEEFPTAVEAVYRPKDGYAIVVDGSHVVAVKARHDEQGKVTQVKFLYQSSRESDWQTQKTFQIKGIQDMGPADLREHIKVYKVHEDY